MVHSLKRKQRLSSEERLAHYVAKDYLKETDFLDNNERQRNAQTTSFTDPRNIRPPSSIWRVPRISKEPAYDRELLLFAFDVDQQLLPLAALPVDFPFHVKVPCMRNALREITLIVAGVDGVPVWRTPVSFSHNFPQTKQKQETHLMITVNTDKVPTARNIEGGPFVVASFPSRLASA